MAGRVVRNVVAIFLALGLAVLVYPVGPYAVLAGFQIAARGLFGGGPDPVLGAAFVSAGLVLTAAPVLLVVGIVRPPRSLGGWAVAAGYLVLTGVLILYAVENGFLTDVW